MTRENVVSTIIADGFYPTEQVCTTEHRQACVVTLAGLIGWQGLHLNLLSPQGAINIPDQGIIAALTHASLPAVAGWSFGAVMIGCYLAAVVVDVRRRRAAVLPCPALWRRTVRLALLCTGLGLTVGVLNSWRGVPVALACWSHSRWALT